jgi:type I restriction-modification system DNA methylase subunit
MQSSKLLYQTPIEVCKYMASLIPEGVVTVLEPTPGEGNLVSVLDCYQVSAPTNFFSMKKRVFDCIIMNPPFSSKSAFGMPDYLKNSGMKIGYDILFSCMEMSDNIIALMPWFTISDSDVRMRFLKKFGMKSITVLPRKTFNYAKIQTCVLQLQKGYAGSTEFKVYDLLNDKSQKLF